jgi:hypothetical protein
MFGRALEKVIVLSVITADLSPAFFSAIIEPQNTGTDGIAQITQCEQS